MRLTIHTDGGARGNPGPAAIGVTIADTSGKELAGFGKRIGETTNNVAEYSAVIEALRFVISLKNTDQKIRVDAIDFYLDSQLVVNQLNGLFKVKNAGLRELLTSVRILESDLGVNTYYRAIPREENRRADYFVNQALDASV